MVVKMIDMALTPEEKVEMAGYSPVNSVPDYSYGLCLSLCDEDLEKLGLDDDVSVGDVLQIYALAKVTSVSERETNGEADRRVELQITNLGLGDDHPFEASARKRTSRYED